MLKQIREQNAFLTLEDVQKARRFRKPKGENALPASKDFELIRAEWLLGFAHPEDVQMLSHLQGAYGMLEWKANLLWEEADGTQRQVTFLQKSMDEITLEREPITFASLAEAIKAYHMVTIRVPAPYSGDIGRKASHAFAVHGIEWQNEDEGQVAKLLINDSGPRMTGDNFAIERAGAFLTKEGIFPVAAVDRGRNVKLPGEIAQSWLHGVNKVTLTYVGDPRFAKSTFEAQLTATMLIPSGPRIHIVEGKVYTSTSEFY